MKEYHQLYKCRLCDELFTNGVATLCEELVDEVTLQLAKIGKSSEPIAGGLIDCHKCKNGVLAIGDFVGWEVKELN